MGGKSPSRRDVFKKTHKEIFKNGKSNTRQVSDAIANMDNYATEHPEIEDVGTYKNDIYSKVMGNEHCGRVRTFGFGVNPTLVFDSTNRQTQNSTREVQFEIERLRAEFEENEAKRKEEMEANEARRQAEMEEIEARRQAKMEANEVRRQTEMKANEARRQAQLEVRLSLFHKQIAKQLHIELEKRLVPTTNLEQDDHSGTGELPDEAASPYKISRQLANTGNLGLLPPNRRTQLMKATKTNVSKVPQIQQQHMSAEVSTQEKSSNLKTLPATVKGNGIDKIKLVAR